MSSVNFPKVGLKVAELLDVEMLEPLVREFVKQSTNPYDDVIGEMVLKVIKEAIADALAKMP
jgi:hypothetical protein